MRVGPGVPERLVMCTTAFLVLMVAEIGVSIFGFDRTLAQHLDHYSTLAAQLGLVGQIAFAFFPLLQRDRET